VAFALQSLELLCSVRQLLLQLLYLHNALLVVRLIVSKLLLQLFNEVLLCCSNLCSCIKLLC
jgi:hypothetical protein